MNPQLPQHRLILAVNTVAGCLAQYKKRFSGTVHNFFYYFNLQNWIRRKNRRKRVAAEAIGLPKPTRHLTKWQCFVKKFAESEGILCSNFDVTSLLLLLLLLLLWLFRREEV